jgi:hypothetical protein
MATAAKLVKSPASAPMAVLLSAEDVAGITGLSVETLAQWRSQRKGIPFLKFFHEFRPVPREVSQLALRTWGNEAAFQQSTWQQWRDPLTVPNVALASRHLFKMSRIHK